MSGLMAANEYHFVTHWYALNTRVEEVHALLADPADLPRWWPAVYLDVRVTEPGDERGVGGDATLCREDAFRGNHATEIFR